MGFVEVLLMGVALSMDACAVGMTNGMSDCKMPLKKTLLIALFFGFFQFLMPVIGYFITGVIAGAFMQTFELVSAWISFALLAFLGGKMVVDCLKSRGEDGKCDCACERLSIGKLCLQAIATSIDALAVGVTLQMAALSPEGLTLGVWWSTAIIGFTTFLLSIAAVYIGKCVGNKLADKASLLGGIVLIAIGLKILIESFV